MTLKKQLKRLSNKQAAEDIKRYIKSSHEFYSDKTPEIKTLAKRLHQEHNLKNFYKIFNKLWKSSSPGENSLAIHTLRLYKDEFDINTWKFLKPKLREIKSWDQVDYIGENILGPLLLKQPSLEKEMFQISKNENIWIKRIIIFSTFSLINKQNIKLSVKLAEQNIYDKNIQIQKAVGIMLCKISRIRPGIFKKFVLKHIDMPHTTFGCATEYIPELRKLRALKPKRRFILFGRGL